MEFAVRFEKKYLCKSKKLTLSLIICLQYFITKFVVICNCNNSRIYTTFNKHFNNMTMHSNDNDFYVFTSIHADCSAELITIYKTHETIKYGQNI